MKNVLLLLILSCLISFSQKNNTLIKYTDKAFYPCSSITAMRFQIGEHTYPTFKSNLDDKYLCDSVYGYMFNPQSDSVLHNKTVYNYDENGNLISELYFIWDITDNQWIVSQSDTTKYNSEGDVVLFRRYNWNTTSKELFIAWGYENTFDSKGNLSIHVDNQFDINNKQWFPERKVENTYNQNGEAYLSVIYKWETDKWTKLEKYETFFDINNFVSSSYIYLWNSVNNDWLNSEKREFFYEDGINNLDISYLWDQNSSQWVNSRKYERLFDSDGRPTVFSYYNWDTINENWVGDWRIENDYYEKNKVLYVYYTWNTDNSDWISHNKAELTYDLQGNLVLNITASWDKINNKWANYGKEENFFEENGNKLLTIFQYQNQDEQWQIGSKYYYYNSLHIPVVNTLNSEDLNSPQIFPNPAIGSFSVKINDPSVSHIQLFNINGHLIKTFNIDQGSNILDISSEKPGLYIIKIFGKEKITTQKIIIE